MKACHYYENGPDDGNSHPQCVDECGLPPDRASGARNRRTALWCRECFDSDKVVHSGYLGGSGIVACRQIGSSKAG